MSEDGLWDVKDVARYLKLSERAVYDKARRGELPSIRMGDRWRFRKTEIDRWLAGLAPGPAQASNTDSSGKRVPSRSDLEQVLATLEDPIKRRLAFVALLTEACVARGWPAPVVVGGHAVEFYTAGGYTTMDIDLVSESEPLSGILGEWGFSREGRHWIDEELGLVVEAPGARLDPGQREHLTEVKAAGLTAYVLGIEDLVVDRLAACVHWSSDDDWDLAAALLEAHRDRIDEEYLRQRAAAEKVGDRLEAMLSGGGGQ